MERALLSPIGDVAEATASGIDRRFALFEAKTDALASNSVVISARSEQVANGVAALSLKTAELEGLIRTVLSRQCPSFPAEDALPQSEKELVRLAESLAILRPLIPYPEWRFDADWYNTDLSFQLRQHVLRHFAENHCEAPVMTPWHLDTRLCLYLDNDLSRQIFIAGQRVRISGPLPDARDDVPGRGSKRGHLLHRRGPARWAQRHRLGI